MSNQPVSDFKRQIQESASAQVPSWGKSVPRPTLPPAPPPRAQTPTASGSSEQGPNGKKKKHKSDIVWSQPSDTGTGTQRGTQLAFALDYLKKSLNPLRLQDLAMFSGVPSLMEDPILLSTFESDPNVSKNPANGLYTWVRVYNSRTPQQLLEEISLRGRDGGGLSVKALKEGFPDVVTHIEQLEKQGKVLVTRATKDNQPKFVFWNEITPEQGGNLVDDEFRSLWDTLNNPLEADLLRSLERDGIQATGSEDLPIKPLPKKKPKKSKGPSQRTAKITNTHVAGVDLTKDYVKPST